MYSNNGRIFLFVRKELDIMCLSYSNFHSIADNCCKATWSQTELPLAFHGKDNWECLGLYHRNHKNKGFNGDGHSPGLVISRCVACVLAIHAQVMGVGRKGLMAAPRPPCAWQHTGNTQLMNSPGKQRETLQSCRLGSTSAESRDFGISVARGLTEDVQTAWNVC